MLPWEIDSNLGYRTAETAPVKLLFTTWSSTRLLTSMPSENGQVLPLRLMGVLVTNTNPNPRYIFM
jgi:hypothetical protein